MDLRAKLRLRGETVGSLLRGRMAALGLSTDAIAIITYIGDALIIAAVVVSALYCLSHPEKIDAMLDWILGRG